jgi:dipeptidyl-peptidase-3
VLARTAALNIAGFTGFMNPRLELVRDAQGKITDVKLFNEESYVEQNLRYSRDYHFLPNLN